MSRIADYKLLIFRVRVPLCERWCFRKHTRNVFSRSALSNVLALFCQNILWSRKNFVLFWNWSWISNCNFNGIYGFVMLAQRYFIIYMVFCHLHKEAISNFGYFIETEFLYRGNQLRNIVRTCTRVLFVQGETIETITSESFWRISQILLNYSRLHLLLFQYVKGCFFEKVKSKN